MPDRQPSKPSARATGRTSFAAHELAQANEPPNKDRTSFSAAELNREPPQPDAPTLRDQDNVQMRPKPRGISLDHPRMAPPGMSGIKTGDRAVGLARSSALSDNRPADRPALSKEPGEVRREFKGLASGQVKDRDIGR
jgi:hypothetical protein